MERAPFSFRAALKRDCGNSDLSPIRRLPPFKIRNCGALGSDAAGSKCTTLERMERRWHTQTKTVTQGAINFLSCWNYVLCHPPIGSTILNSEFKSIVHRALGADFERLHPKIREQYGISGQSHSAYIGSGIMTDVWHGRWYVVPFLHKNHACPF